MRLSTSLAAVLLATSWWISACTEPAPPAASTPETILKVHEGGDFRGVNMGDAPHEVIASEGSNAVYSMPDELVYRIVPRTADSTWYEISYNFNEQGLYDIHLDLIFKNDSIKQSLRQEFFDYYSNKYGVCDTTSGAVLWRTMTEKGSFVSIEMHDTPEKQGKPTMLIHFNEQKQP